MKSHHQGLKQICQQFGVLTLYALGSQAKKIKDLVEGRQDIPLLSPSDVGIGVKPRAQRPFGRWALLILSTKLVNSNS